MIGSIKRIVREQFEGSRVVDEMKGWVNSSHLPSADVQNDKPMIAVKSVESLLATTTR